MRDKGNSRNQEAAAEARMPLSLSEPELAVLKVRLRSDPDAAHAFLRAQEQCRGALDRLAREIMSSLTAAMRAPNLAGADWKQIAALARDRELAARELRQLAQDLILGALVNVGNPAWDPFDPSTSADPSGSAFLALLDPGIAAPGRPAAHARFAQGIRPEPRRD